MEERTKTMAANTGGDKILYVRVPSAKKDALDDIARDENQSASKVVNRLIEYLVESTTAQRQALLGGKTAEEGAVNIISHLMMRQSWADHAFNHKRWTWACEEYMHLARMSEEGNAPGTWRLAQYKLGYCWIEIGIDLQSKAIELRKDEGDTTAHNHRVRELFNAAEWAMRASIAFNRRYYKYKGQEAQPAEYHAVVQYNIACTWALLAKSRIERELEGRDIEVRRTRSEDLGGLWPLWPLPEKWEESIDGSKWSGLVEETLRCLTELAQGNGRGEHTTSPADRAFLLELAKKDADLAFIRDANALRGRFSDAITTRGDDDMLAAFKKSRALVEPYVRDDLPDIDEVLREVDQKVGDGE